MTPLHDCLHPNHIEYYLLILALYNVSKFSGNSVPLVPKPNETIP